MYLHILYVLSYICEILNINISLEVNRKVLILRRQLIMRVHTDNIIISTLIVTISTDPYWSRFLWLRFYWSYFLRVNMV